MFSSSLFSSSFLECPASLFCSYCPSFVSVSIFSSVQPFMFITFFDEKLSSRPSVLWITSFSSNIGGTNMKIKSKGECKDFGGITLKSCPVLLLNAPHHEQANSIMRRCWIISDFGLFAFQSHILIIERQRHCR